MKTATGRFRQLWLNMPLRRKGLIVTAIPLVALVFFSVAFVVVQGGYMGATAWIKTALQRYSAMQKVHTVLLEEDHALATYALTNDPAYLKNYRDATKESEKLLPQLRATLTGQPEQMARVDTLTNLFADRRAATDIFLAGLSQPNHDAAALSRTWLSQIRQSNAQIDQQTKAMQDVVVRVLTDQARALATAIKRSDLAVLLSIAVGLIGGFVAMLLFATGIVRRVDELQENAGGLLYGEMKEPRYTSDDEIGKLNDTLRETARVLKRQTVDLEQRARELSESEAANQKQARLLECILNSMAEAVVVADSAGELVLCNPAAWNLLGEGALCSTLTNMLEQVSIYRADTMTPCPEEEIPLVRAIRGENPGNLELVLRSRSTGEDIWLDAVARPLRRADDVTRGGVAVFRDITASKKIEETLRQARAEAERANHAKSEFLSRMSHELRTPMNAILGFAQLLDLDELTPPQRQSVDQILKGGRHLLTLINEVLDLARIEAGKLTLSIEPIHAGEAVQSTIDLLEPLAREHDIIFRKPESTGWARFILADRQRFQQVILNLLSNAIKYNQPGGSVTIACQVKEGVYFRLAITDTGEGVPAEKIDKLFQPFERLVTDQSGIEGTGIGLALSKRLMLAMGGTIGVESRIGAGSTFWLELPLGECPLNALPSPEPEIVEERAPAAPAARKLKLLYIEDNLSNNLLMQRILQSRPEVQLISAMQGRIGLELASQHAPDLIFLDLHLPDMTGDEVLRALRQRSGTAETPIVMISADATPSQVDRLYAAGANEYFTKPLDIRRLLTYVDEVLGVGV
ncbi:MAG TPA: ATP-binding protein [Bryobacteraceae bacterium]|nr:ATP-binding protein [Bryobacteraceae bacterium]